MFNIHPHSLTHTHTHTPHTHTHTHSHTSYTVVPRLCHISQLEHLLERCKLSDQDRTHKEGVSHHAFPVVASKTSNRCVGLVTRLQLEYALVAAKEHNEHTLHFIHILKYADRSPLTVFPNTRLSRACELCTLLFTFYTLFTRE